MTKKSVQALIICSWALLFICLVIKLCGGNLFEFKTNNLAFIGFCETASQSKVLSIVIPCLFNVTTTYPAMCVFMNKKYLNLKETLIIVPLLVVKSVIGMFLPFMTYILDLFILILIPMILTKFKYWKRILIGNVFVFVFQVLAISIRAMSVNFNEDNQFLSNVMFQLDYFLMILLYYFYNFKYCILKQKEV